MVGQHIGLVRSKRNGKQVFCSPTERSRSAVLIDPKRNVEADKTRDHCEKLPQESPPDESELVLLLGEEVVVRDVILKILALLVIDAALRCLFQTTSLLDLKLV